MTPATTHAIQVRFAAGRGINAHSVLYSLPLAADPDIDDRCHFWDVAWTYKANRSQLHPQYRKIMTRLVKARSRWPIIRQDPAASSPDPAA